MAEALYRKYRPQTFEGLVGQGHIERTLKNAIEQDKVSHAYLFCGPRGTGKTTMARLLAKALLCENGPTATPDGTCPECEQIALGIHPDVYELDAASRTGVDNVREEIIARVQYAPTRGRKKIYIIDEVHMLTNQAFNALLKTLEEPPAHVVFILCTTDPQKVPETIHSRCQRFDFHRLSTDEIVSRLGAVCVGEDVDFEGEALELIAHRAEGGMRNALTSLEQLIAFGEGHVSVKGAEDLLGSLDSTDMAEVMQAVGRRDPAACFRWIAGYVESGADLVQFARDMAEHVRNIYVLLIAGDDVELEVSEDVRRELVAESKLFRPDRCARILEILSQTIAELRTANNQRLCFEIACTRMVRPDSDLTLASLAERVEALEAGQSAVAMTVAATAAAPVSHTPQTASVQEVPVSAPAEHAGIDKPATQTAQPTAVNLSADAQSVSVVAEEEPLQTAAQPAIAASGDVAGIIANPAALQRAWKVALADIKKAKAAHGAFFINAKARPSADGTGVEILFPADSGFIFKAAQKPDVQDLLKQAFARAMGSSVVVTCVKADQGDTVAPVQTAQAVEPARPSQVQAETVDVVDVQTEPENGAYEATDAFIAPEEDKVPVDVYDSGALVEEAEPAQETYEKEAVPQQQTTPEDAAAADDAEEVAPVVGQQDFGQMLSQSMGQTITFEEVQE